MDPVTEQWLRQIPEVEKVLQRYADAQVVVVADRCFQPQWDVAYPTFFIEADEQHKTLTTMEQLWSWLSEQHVTRHALLINIGGGIISDMGGFAAATYRRGIDYMNIPTTLLAMVDAAHGGKTGINFGGMKNQIGVIRQPVATVIDTRWLETLPTRAFLSGYAELLKTMLLDSRESVMQAVAVLEEWSEGKLRMTNDELQRTIHRAIDIKERIVHADPDEKGLRKQLNLGHTIGHALEEAGIQRGMPIEHGYAVMQGMVAELYLSQIILRTKECTKDKCTMYKGQMYDVQRTNVRCTKGTRDTEMLRLMSRILIEYYGKMNYSCKDYGKLITLMQDDKKNLAPGEINFTLLLHAGDARINQTATDEQIREALDYLFNI